MEIYLSTYSKIKYLPELKTLVFIWKMESCQLEENGVKIETEQILHFMKIYTIRNIIIDATHYVFRNHDSLQRWLIGTFMPKIVESTVANYGIVVNPEEWKQYSAMDIEEDEDLAVQYFPHLESAKHWIAGKLTTRQEN